MRRRPVAPFSTSVSFVLVVVLRQAPKLIAFDVGANVVMDRRRALAAVLLFSLVSCSRHEPLAPVNFSPPPPSNRPM